MQGVPKALEIVEQYIREKEILPAKDPNNEVLAKELMNRLIVRFRREIHMNDKNEVI